MNDTTGLAVFVKTPGLSPVKTRLAASIGQAAAEEFYRRSLAAIECCMSDLKASGLAHPYWAVTEEDALSHPMWHYHSTVAQGKGCLGDRLARVLKGLSQRHRNVIAIGGDSPQISVATLRGAIQQLNQFATPAHVVGRCHDGGFYLVGSNYCVAPEVWSSISYSTDTTADELIALLDPVGPIYELGQMSDVDTYNDLVVLVRELEHSGKIGSAQQDLLGWIRGVLRK